MTIEPTPLDPTPLDQLSRLFQPVIKFVRTELFGSSLLLLVTLVALIWANSPWRETYEGLIHGSLSISFESIRVEHSIQEWVNDVLMTLFFFLIGLEIKRELVTGRLRDRRAIALPALAALGGMLVPAVIYAAYNAGGPASHGWAVPVATDIAFALGVLGLVGRRAPIELRLFLLTLAILDDIAGILVIAFFYSKGIEPVWLLALASTPALVLFMRWLGIHSIWPYIPPGIMAWYFALKCGVHPTIAGVIVGLMTPAMPIGGRKILEHLEHNLHPWVAFLTLPLFALVNAGVHLDLDSLDNALNRNVTWGVFTGLTFGKIIGVVAFSWLGLKLGMARLPGNLTMRHIIAMAPLTGIGFTVGIFIANLSFTEPARLSAAKVGLLAGSLVAAIIGLLLLARLKPSTPTTAVQ